MQYSLIFVSEFISAVENIKVIAWEWRHRCAGKGVENEINNFCKFLDDVKTKANFVSNKETYIRSKVREAMDHLKFTIMPNFEQTTFTYRTFNSMYDVLKCFYFGI